MIRFYRIQPSEWEGLDHHSKLGLLYWMEPIKSRERLEYQDTVGSLFDGDREFQISLAQSAYQDDPEALAARLEAFTRKG